MPSGVAGAAGLHDDHRRGELGEEGQELVGAQPRVAVEGAGAAGDGELERGLCEVDADQGIVHGTWHIDADQVAGGVHSIIAADGARAVDAVSVEAPPRIWVLRGRCSTSEG